MSREYRITDAKGGAAFTVRCVTRAERTEAVAIQDDGLLKVRLQASPAGAPEANAELVEFLAYILNVPSKAIEIVAGQDGRDKLVSIEGITTDYVEACLDKLNLATDGD
jgi:uncharacterized protein YggU (UPF0235/DUF167 family)